MNEDILMLSKWQKVGFRDLASKSYIKVASLDVRFGIIALK